MRLSVCHCHISRFKYMQSRGETRAVNARASELTCFPYDPCDCYDKESGDRGHWRASPAPGAHSLPYSRRAMACCPAFTTVCPVNMETHGHSHTSVIMSSSLTELPGHPFLPLHIETRNERWAGYNTAAPVATNSALPCYQTTSLPTRPLTLSALCVSVCDLGQEAELIRNSITTCGSSAHPRLWLTGRLSGNNWSSYINC